MTDRVGPNRFPGYGIFGGLIILAMSVALVRGYRPLTTWATPACWWGYILLLDAVILAMTGSSLIRSRRREFLLQLPLSVAFWLVFEAYNLHLRNWHYVGLPRHWAVEWAGRIIAYATIMPALFETSELMLITGVFSRLRSPPMRWARQMALPAALAGMVCLIVPLLLPARLASYSFGLVWVGFLLLLDPVVYASGGQSLLGEVEGGRLERIVSLLAAGYSCGFLWELWNYWAATKWQYNVPFTPAVRIFEMPLAGFVGFGPFALEYHAMYSFVRLCGPRRN